MPQRLGSPCSERGCAVIPSCLVLLSAVNGARDETFRRGFDALKDVHVALALRRARLWCRGVRSPRPPSGPSPTRALPLSAHRLPPAPSRSPYRRLGYVSEHHSSNHGCDGRARGLVVLHRSLTGDRP